MADTCFYQKSITFAMYSLKIETILNYDSILRYIFLLFFLLLLL